jgi:hypothetical protein
MQVLEREREMEREMMERREREYRGYGKMDVDEKSGMKNGESRVFRCESR